MEGTRSSGFSRAARGAPDTTDVRCSSTAGPYLRLSRFQGGQAVNKKITLSGAPPPTSPDSLTLPSATTSRFRNFNPIPFRCTRLERYQTASPICTDDRSAQARALVFAATAAPSYSSGLALAPTAGYRSRALAPSIFGLVDSADERFARQYRCGPPPEFPLASPRSGIVHHLSGPDRYALTRTLHKRSGRSAVQPTRGSHQSLPCALRFTRPLTRTHVRLLGPCFKTCRMGAHRPTPERASAEARRISARCRPQS
ncbi:hypothetical protein KIW84_UN0424 [Lathyrus oleraceus]|nr:hypothetical protein KIW84_UN0424 [Pisum sativum]